MVTMSGRPPKLKGATYERELATFFNTNLFGGEDRICRALLSGGGRERGGADLEGFEFLHVEAKRVERLDFRGAMRQAERSCGDTIPIVVTRRNGEPTGDSLTLLRLRDFVRLTCNSELMK
jgi:hypothetical protein